MVQKYLSEITKSGDKRIILIDGQPVPMALARIPSPGDHRGNMVVGARTEARPCGGKSVIANAVAVPDKCQVS